MSSVGVTDRERRASAVLEDAAVAGRVRSGGPDGEIAVVAAAAEALPALQRLAPRLRELGYRYVALDLAGGDH